MQVKESFLRDLLRLIVWFPLRWLISLLPLDSTFRVFKLMGDFHFLIDRPKRQYIMDRFVRNLAIDKNQAYRFVRRYFELHYLDRMHIILYPRLMLKKDLSDIVRIENIDMLTRLIDHQQGVLIVQPHFGPVQITLLALSLNGFNPLQIGYQNDIGLSKIGKRIAFKYRLYFENKLPAPIISANGYMGNAYKHLLDGGIVLTTGDGAGGGIYLGEHKDYKFFHNNRKIPLGPASLSIRTGAIFLPTFIIPDKYNHFRILFENPIEPKYNNFEIDKIYMMGEFVSIAEKYIRKYPYNWHFWDEI